MELDSYCILREFCDNEGETWYYFIIEKDNEEFLDLLADRLEAECEDHEFELWESELYHTDTLINIPKIEGYGTSHTIIQDKMSIDKLNDVENLSEFLYKGGISSLKFDKEEKIS